MRRDLAPNRLVISREAWQTTPVSVCAGPLIWLDVPGDWGDMNARRLAECERCGDLLVLSDHIDAKHRDAPLIEDARRVRGRP